MGSKEEKERTAGLKALNYGIKRFILSQTGRTDYDEKLTPKIGRFVLSLTSVEPSIPLAGKHLRDISTKQRTLFQCDEYEGAPNSEFLGNWLHQDAFFLFSNRTVSVVTREIVKPGAVHKMVSRLCHERPSPVIPYEKLAMAVPRFVREMNGKMKYLSVDKNYMFENAEVPSGDGVWVRTAPINALLSVLDHQDVHIHRGRDFIVIYNRWFGLYCQGE